MGGEESKDKYVISISARGTICCNLFLFMRDQSRSIEKFEKALELTASRCSRVYYSCRVMLVVFYSVLLLLFWRFFQNSRTVGVSLDINVLGISIAAVLIIVMQREMHARGVEPGSAALERMNRAVLEPSCGITYDARVRKMCKSVPEGGRTSANMRS